MKFECGGTVTDINKLPIGTYFYVYNGCWNGFIGEDDDGKYLKVIEKNTIHRLNKSHYLSIGIIKEEVAMNFNISRRRYIIVRKCDESVLTDNGFINISKLGNKNITMYNDKNTPLELIKSWEYSEKEIQIVPVVERISIN